MADPIPVPVGILRLPRGPDSSGSRGFSRHRDPDDSRDNSRDDSRDPAAVQSARAALRERFLRLLGRARGKRARFCLWNGLRLLADFGAADVHSGAFQVDSLLTPLGIQASALLRSGDVLEFSFPLE
ncbi:gem-associated protein 7 [Haemorhous mexicanus]|uniref:gem-associated protein 7 n=1 Tax=Haemorhous mexicanus TaxID=30427 RepID=UPI0028BF46B8|nr:gem-associated protein 7 [Haemorhous mexicanus]XP_059728428.1 gem-associated protein 7 [Haemorhous mexicanus]